MPANPKLRFDLLQFRSHPLSHRLPKHDELSIPGFITRMCEAKEVESLGLAFATPPPILGRKASELDETGLVSVQFQLELQESFLQFRMEPLGIRAMLESNHESSSPGESHPQALTEPDVNVSAHPAPIVQSLV